MLIERYGLVILGMDDQRPRGSDRLSLETPVQRILEQSWSNACPLLFLIDGHPGHFWNPAPKAFA